MPDELTLGFSPCPNDTFIFYALVHGKLNAGDIRFREHIEDVEALNLMALRGELDITKISFHALGHFRESYVVLRSGAALGKGCGPLLLSREPMSSSELEGKRIAIPGGYTTANLLLALYLPGAKNNPVPMLFSDIMPAIRDGKVDAGLVIHEGRFTYPAYGLSLVRDLGEWWEGETGLPIPLGGIVGKRSLGESLLKRIEDLVRESILYSRRNPEEASGYIKSHAQEMDDSVIQSHIGLYVNDDTVGISAAGEGALRVLFNRAERAGLIKPCGLPLFL